MIYAEIDMEDLLKIERALNMTKDKSKYILRAAINNAAKDVKKELVNGVSQRYVWKSKKSINEATDIKKAKIGNLQAVVTMHSKEGELYDFKLNDKHVYPGSKGAPRWFKAKALRNSSLKSIALKKGSSGDQYKAFTIRYKSGHETLAQRVPGKTMKSNPGKEFVKTFFAPSVPTMGSVVYDNVLEGKVEDILAENIRQQVERFLG